MKLLKRQISAKDGSGMVLLRPDTSEDLWHVYNLLQVDDLVRCTTVRKIVKESATGSTTSSKQRMMLTIRVSKLDFDSDVLQVRISGPVTSEVENVRLGSHHTLTLELHQNFSIEKLCWDQIFLDRIEEATHPDRQAEVAAVVLQSGLAHVCLITGALTITKARLETNIPKKRTGSSAHGKSLTKFYESVYQAIMRHIDMAKVKCVLLGSPGFVKDDLMEYMMSTAVKREDKVFLQNKSKFVLCKASSGHKHAIDEMLGDPAIQVQLTETKVMKETQVLQKFMRMMETDPDRACYGYAHVNHANDHLAIDSLLVTDELFRSANVTTRRKYVQMVETVRERGGSVFVFSSMHVSGQHLQQVSGVAALLRFPLPDLDELDNDDAAEPDVDSTADDAEYDPNRRIREDVEDMGL